MNYTIVNGAVEFGAETILEEINFEIKGKDKIAVIGRNGAGKSTLLKALIDNSMLTEGIGEEKFNIYKESSINIGYLKQVDFEDENITMLDEILKVYKPVLDLEKKMEKLLEKMQNDKSEELATEYSKTMDRYEFLEGYTYKKEYETVINKFGFSVEDKSKKISEFSGGQRTKIAFIKLLLSKPDILLLDEPTNHLDVTTIEWLEGYLKSYPRAIVIVSHDRMFLDKIVNKVYEIEYGAITKYTGNYTEFEKQKKVNYEKQLKDYEYQQAEIKRLMRVVDRFRYKATKAKMAQSKLKQIEHMVKVKEPSKYDLTSFKTNFKLEKESGRDVLHVRDLQIGYTNTIQTVSFDLYRGQKLAVIGENGIGKSTLLKTLVNKLEKLGGKFEFGHNVEIGYFDQQMALLDSEKTVFDDFASEFPLLTTTEIRNSLAAFMFCGEDVFKTINMLSGGEKVRLQLAKILKKGPNFLVLDEPTNHMDIVGKESLELLLKEYTGTILFVSHDRFFVNKIADSLLVFTKSGVKYYDKTYSEYELEKQEEVEEKVVEQKKEKNTNNLYLQQKEQARKDARIKKIEREIDELEKQVAQLKEELQKEENYTDYEKLSEIQNKIDELNGKIETLMIEWEDLS
ncbi:MAG: ABC-F type ribosomal protection protein [Clostridia bacterium]|jgi:ATP-binding cassette subfamily F protein 3|nr:ABC-F type ribosomal protection protein [Clostridia bacterium]